MEDKHLNTILATESDEFIKFCVENIVPNPSSIWIKASTKGVSKYVLEILKKYRMESCDPVGTPMEIKDKLDLDQNGTLVDATKYHSMIGALMYLTSSRPDIVHATCLCARYQAKPTEKHLKEVKRIFRYLRGTVNTGLWYTKDSIELTGFSDADYAGCKDSFKSTFGGAQFLGEKLVKENQEKDKIGSKPDKNGKRVEAEKSLKQLQWIEEEKLSKTQKEWPKTQIESKAIQVLKRKKKRKGSKVQMLERSTTRA
uniref:Reverse transcriptase Ty1/copia-type domain-containing protein n=1 Tax=Tanacetum cinerariifolium TaxID=118510 RepID=A0A699JNI5_TANCI|nr:hypothetical protein [Tanacetum cinerariifolium]